MLVHALKRVLILNKGNSKENSVRDQSVYPISRIIRVVFFDGVTQDVSAVECKIIHHAHGPFDYISVPTGVISVVKNERFLL